MRKLVHLASESVTLFVEPHEEVFKEEDVDWVRLMSADDVALLGGLTGTEQEWRETQTRSVHKTLARELSQGSPFGSQRLIKEALRNPQNLGCKKEYIQARMAGHKIQTSPQHLWAWQSFAGNLKENH